ncbi:Linear gramicidin synthase subunit B [Nonomuraea coxensis DSM 45129]|uniref:Linear gramicidin synthase subunit B n=1 Tax=Nonomuraea coxensis DSM 45129 TaxID=1122611 RepID=A0ABX8U4B7_9ACTN|nr:condensation domain-containing protein [Nonomuraea coxensis]QYC41594.1 Linear gramicidin synthase subunit B [Nonomuraea coxensis DSM 45129]
MSAADKRALLAELMRTGAAPVPLSYGQRALWFMDRIRPEAGLAYHMPFAWTMRGRVDLEALRRAFDWLAERHPIFRTTYSHARGTPVQRVNPAGRIAFRVLNLEPGQDPVEVLETAARRPFDLARGPVSRVAVVRGGDGPPVLLWVTHHIAVDGWSLFQLLEELGTAYAAFARNGAPDLPAPAATYGDYVLWQAAMLAGPEGRRLERHWSGVLGDRPPPLRLPADRPRPADQTFGGAALPLRLGPEAAARVAELAAAAGTTLYTALLTGFELLLGRACGQEDFLLGTWASGRTRPEFAGTAGYFVNPVVVRAGLSGDPTFAEALGRARRVVLDALDHQDYPFPLLVERLGVPRDPSRSPLFDVAFTLRASQRGAIERSGSGGAASPLGAAAPGERGMLVRLGDLELTTFPLPQRTIRFDLEMELIAGDGVSGLLRYNTALFDEATAAWLADGYVRLLTDAAAHPGRPLSALDWAERPRPAAPPDASRARRDHREAPDELVDVVIGIWARVLDLDPGEIGPDDDFFERGGHSLAAVQVSIELQERLGAEVSISDIFHDLTPAALAARLGGPALPGPRPLPREPGADFPLSYAQESLWVLHQLAPESLAYNAPHVFRLRGPLDVAALERALGRVVAGHEALRTVYAATRRGPVQRVLEPGAFRLPVADVADAAEAMERALAEYRTPFDLAAGPPVRPVLYRVGPAEHVLLFLVHHIAFDGWSAAVFWRDLCGHYLAETGGGAPPAPPAVQCVDHAVWERAALTGERLDRLTGYWRERLAGAARAPLPTDLPRPRRPRFEGAQHAFDLDVDVRELCRAADATPHMVHLAAFQLWLAGRTGSADVVTGSVVSGRSRAETTGLIGHFVNVLAVRTDLTGARTFAEALARVRRGLLADYEHQELPLPLLGGRPPFDALFTLHDTRLLESAADALPGVAAERLAVPLGTAQFDLALEVTDLGGRARAVLEYDTALFLPGTAAAMAEELRRLTTALVTDPDRPLTEVTP